MKDMTIDTLSSDGRHSHSFGEILLALAQIASGVALGYVVVFGLRSII